MMDVRDILQNQSLGPMEMEIEDGEIVTDLVVIARVQSMGDTADQILLTTTEHSGGVVTHGILTSAVLLHSSWMTDGRGDEE